MWSRLITGPTVKYPCGMIILGRAPRPVGKACPAEPSRWLVHNRQTLSVRLEKVSSRDNQLKVRFCRRTTFGR